jgi:hypothetical protein
MCLSARSENTNNTKPVNYIIKLIYSNLEHPNED